MTSTQQIEKLVKVYKSVAQNPSLTGARILEVTTNRTLIQSIWSQRNLERKTNQKFVQDHILNEKLEPISESFPIDVTNELLSASTEDQQHRAVLRQATIENSTKQFIEIWDKQHLIKNYDLAALDVHGDVYADSEFGALEWSPDKTKLLYIAEKKLPKAEPFYKQKSLDKKVKDSEKEKKEESETVIGKEYDYKPDWGEQLVGKHRPVVVVLDTTADTIVALSGIPDKLSPGQVTWTNDGKNIIGVAWKHEPRHLGLIYCTNRHSWIFMLKDGEYQKLSRDGCAVCCPRISPDGKHLVWLEREAGGPHHNAHRLMYRNLQSDEKKIDTLVDIVKTSVTINQGKDFYGLYGRLVKRCWSKDSKYLFLSTPQQSDIRSYAVNIESKNIVQITNDSRSIGILDVKDGLIAFWRTSVLEPMHLILARFVPETLDTGIKTVDITSPLNVPSFEDLMYEHNEYNYDNSESVKTLNFTYFGVKSGRAKSIPLVVVPHGGPHNNFTNTFTLNHSVLTTMGMAVLQVNFRGSTGMGSANVEYLQGKVGDVDVKDCATATKEALKKYTWLDPERVGLLGGSHGGFLVAHLSAQHADLYKAVVARNPVIDIAVMFSISDIPDWCAAVLKYSYQEESQEKKPDTTEMFTKMLSASPIIHVDKVKAPTLICIGTNDLRVPAFQGKQWYHRLKANNVPTRMLVYEDNHTLGSVPAEMDNTINACLWLMEHMAPQ